MKELHRAPESTSHGGAMIRLLAAEGPHPDHGDKMMLFGQFVGSWDLDLVAYPPGRGARRFVGEWHFGWVLEGIGVQDVLITRPVDEGVEKRGPHGGTGSTLRIYDAHRDAWWVVWCGPADREFVTLLARPEGARIVLEGQWSLEGGGRPFRWVFSEITTNSFRWHGYASLDGGASWQLVEEMTGERRGGNA